MNCRGVLFSRQTKMNLVHFWNLATCNNSLESGTITMKIPAPRRIQARPPLTPITAEVMVTVSICLGANGHFGTRRFSMTMCRADVSSSRSRAVRSVVNMSTILHDHAMLHPAADPTPLPACRLRRGCSSAGIGRDDRASILDSAGINFN